MYSHKYSKLLEVSLGQLTADNFLLPSLRPALRRLSNELHNGHGFFVIRGLRVDEYTRPDNVLIYLGLSTHLAPQLGRQDYQFDGQPDDVLLAHVKDLSLLSSSSGPNGGIIGSPAYTTNKQVFHTDTGDIVSLLALETSAEGGASNFTRPNLIHTLSQPWDVDASEKNDRQFEQRPILFHFPATASTPERVGLQYSRRYFVGFGALPRSDNIPPITEA
ncbi:hypothetical protein HYALB_00003672 [Hymenoscyphus albidus]|uniref:TauD/TfdA-like domain-containing protein n=1 Tax=Hymenoscyphus albidus TaxID=595503 RepID=A0A9N9LET4_9HELO|nr:hypothetical protein HYALB_00003672 [Hymenoscyphus albidus]